MKSMRRFATVAFALFAVSTLLTFNPQPARAQGSCPYYNYCIWVDVDYTWPYCYWATDDGNYWNDWCGSGGGNEHLAANAASSYHNNGAPATFDAIRSFQEEWSGGGLTWYAARGDKVRWVGYENDDAESHHWYNG